MYKFAEPRGDRSATVRLFHLTLELIGAATVVVGLVAAVAAYSSEPTLYGTECFNPKTADMIWREAGFAKAGWTCREYMLP